MRNTWILTRSTRPYGLRYTLCQQLHDTVRTLHTQQLPTRDVVFSGIQPTGIPHIGNWFGALKQWVDLQDKNARLIFAIVDLHAITVSQNPQKLRQWRRETLATFLAMGLKPERCTIFYQSDVPAHTELAWILGCMSPLGSLLRMTTWKSTIAGANDMKLLSGGTDAKARLGLLAYPVLQAADILCHRATKVPVGADQTQHLEFARGCARNFNNACGSQILPEPLAMYAPISRVMSLRSPTKKMSKSDPDERSRILLTDSEESIRMKINGALTDSIDGISYCPQERPGIANMLRLLSYLDSGNASVEQVASRFSGHSLGALKDTLATKINGELSPIRDAYRILMDDTSENSILESVARSGADIARKNAAITMQRVYDAIGM